MSTPKSHSPPITSKRTITKTLLNDLLHHFPPSARGHIVATIGEFTGTIFFLFFAFAGTQVANISSNYNAGTTVITTTWQKTPQQLLYIALSFGFSLAVNAWVYFRISGGLFNPAVTLGMYLISSITLPRCILLTLTQLLASIADSALVLGITPGALNVSTTLSPSTTLAQAFFIELLLTSQLVFTIFMLAAEKHAGNFLAPVGIGLALFVVELTGVFWTGGSVNPARSFGPAVVTGRFGREHWVYWLGPVCGTGLAVGLFWVIKALEYESVGMGPDPEGRVEGELEGELDGGRRDEKNDGPIAVDDHERDGDEDRRRSRGSDREREERKDEG